MVVTAVNVSGLERCLRSIAAQAIGGVPFETIVVLNRAQGEVRDLVQGRVAGVKIVDSDVNRGFAGGSNLGREAASGGVHRPAAR